MAGLAACGQKAGFEMKIAIIGAGIGGLQMARRLTEHGHEVIVFEKAHGVGGRMSTRKAEAYAFDHGAQCFTARSKQFSDFLAPYIEMQVVAEWKGKVMNFELGKKDMKRIWYEKHLVGSPAMNSLCKVMAEGLNVKLATEVAPIKQNVEGKHVLQDINGKELGVFDWVISSAPPAQTANLIQQFRHIEHVKMHCCFALMLGYARKWDKSWIAAKVRNDVVKWISVNSTKMGRDEGITSIVVHSSNNWSDDNVETDIELVKQHMLQSFMQLTGIANSPDHIGIHRWKYAILDDSEIKRPLIDHELKVAASSDWVITSRIEDVWLAAENTVSNILQGRNEVSENASAAGADSAASNISEVIEMAWQDEISFESINKASGYTEKQVIELMRSNLKPSSYKAWRKRK